VQEEHNSHAVARSRDDPLRRHTIRENAPIGQGGLRLKPRGELLQGRALVPLILNIYAPSIAELVRILKREGSW